MSMSFPLRRGHVDIDTYVEGDPLIRSPGPLADAKGGAHQGGMAFRVRRRAVDVQGEGKRERMSRPAKRQSPRGFKGTARDLADRRAFELGLGKLGDVEPLLRSEEHTSEL